MVSSDFGKLEVRRHLISGDDCAIAGEAIAVAAAPAAETFKKSRRFIQVSSSRDVSHISRACPPAGRIHSVRGALRGRLNTDVAGRKRDKGMTSPHKRKYYMALKQGLTRQQ